MRYGTIVQYFPTKKFGFIRPDFGPDIFFHISALGAAESAPHLRIGQPVKYELVPGTEPKRRRPGKNGDDQEPAAGAKRVRPEAKVVELIDKIPGATIENPAGTLTSPHHPRARQRKPTWRR